MTGQEVAQRSTSALQQVANEITADDFKAEIALVLPEGVTPDKFVRTALTGLQAADPSVLKCERGSILTSLLASAQMGLMPDGHEAALVAYGTKAQLIPMIAGYRKIAAEHGWTIRTAVVYEKDEFDFELGDEPTVRHRPPRPGVGRGQKIAAYAVASHRDGRREVAVMDGPEIEQVKAKSRARGGPWVEWEDRMWEKTVGKYLFKRLPIAESERIVRLLAADLDPQQSTTDLYGPSTADEARPEVSPQPPDPGQAAGTVGTDGGETGPQAASIPSSPPEGAGGSGPDEVDWTALDPEPTPEPEYGPQQETRAAAAGEAVVPDGHFAGKTLTQVAATGKQGLGWLLNALKMLPTGDPTRTAVETYVRGEQPDVWGAFEEWQAAEHAGDEAFGDAS